MYKFIIKQYLCQEQRYYILVVIVIITVNKKNDAKFASTAKKRSHQSWERENCCWTGVQFEEYQHGISLSLTFFRFKAIRRVKIGQKPMFFSWIIYSCLSAVRTVLSLTYDRRFAIITHKKNEVCIRYHGISIRPGKLYAGPLHID